MRFASTVQEKAAVKEHFLDRGKIFEVVGSVDGTLIAIVRPKKSAPAKQNPIRAAAYTPRTALITYRIVHHLAAKKENSNKIKTPVAVCIERLHLLLEIKCANVLYKPIIFYQTSNILQLLYCPQSTNKNDDVTFRQTAAR